MSWTRRLGLALLSFTVPPSTVPLADEPLPWGATTIEGPRADAWTRHHAVVHATGIRLNHIGLRTHNNWVFFRLPFATTQLDRLRFVRFDAQVSVPTVVGALRLGSVCVTVPARSGIEDWTRYTVSGVGYTDQLLRHPFPPTDDPTILAINVPTRVANYAACGRDEGRLHEPETWSLTIDWEQR